MGVATVTGGGGSGAGACIDGLQPVDKMQKMTATQQTGLKNLFKDLVDFSER
jgi:NAD(P)H-dependent FMN reductase